MSKMKVQNISELKKPLTSLPKNKDEQDVKSNQSTKK